jgi:Family of unknown function (DUF5681)
MAGDKDKGAYEVGYGKPPKHSRFKAGQSGNRHGRPTGTRNLKTDLAEELAERIRISEGGRRRAVSKQRGMLKQLMAKALRGDVRAANTVLGLVERLFDARADADASAALTAQDEAIVSDFLRRHGVAEQALAKTADSNRSEADAESSDAPRDEDACHHNGSDSSHEP